MYTEVGFIKTNLIFDEQRDLFLYELLAEYTYDKIREPEQYASRLHGITCIVYLEMISKVTSLVDKFCLFLLRRT